MPIFEYRCEDCGKVSEILIRNSTQEPQCSCGSHQMEKQFSAFAVSEVKPSFSGGCADGSCGVPSSPCASGMCGL